MTATMRKKLLQVAVLLAVAGVEGWGWGAQPEHLPESAGVSAAELETVRGGYVGGDGLEVSFGITKSLLLNGVPLAADGFTVTLNGQPVNAAQGAVGAKVMQNGAGNAIAPSALSSARAGAFTFLQNTLNGAAIKNITTINASINVLGLYRSLNLSNMIRQQLINGLH